MLNCSITIAHHGCYLFGAFGIAVTGYVCGDVLRVKPAKHPHIFPLPREIPNTHLFLCLNGELSAAGLDLDAAAQAHRTRDAISLELLLE